MTDQHTPPPLTPEQAAIIGAFTGILCGPFQDLHAYAERKLGRPIWTHEFPDLADALKEAARDDFIALVQVSERAAPAPWQPPPEAERPEGYRCKAAVVVTWTDGAWVADRANPATFAPLPETSPTTEKEP